MEFIVCTAVISQVCSLFKKWLELLMFYDNKLICFTVFILSGQQVEYGAVVCLLTTSA